MAEFILPQTTPPETDQGSVTSNVKKFTVGDGRWSIDSTALRLRDENGNVIIYIGV